MQCNFNFLLPISLLLFINFTKSLRISEKSLTLPTTDTVSDSEVKSTKSNAIFTPPISLSIPPDLVHLKFPSKDQNLSANVYRLDELDFENPQELQAELENLSQENDSLENTSNLSQNSAEELSSETDTDLQISNFWPASPDALLEDFLISPKLSTKQELVKRNRKRKKLIKKQRQRLKQRQKIRKNKRKKIRGKITRKAAIRLKNRQRITNCRRRFRIRNKNRIRLRLPPIRHKCTPRRIDNDNDNDQRSGTATLAEIFKIFDQENDYFRDEKENDYFRDENENDYSM